ncbi:3-ketoacyl-(Acyl-carrier-protein) reductase [Sulfitobacter noctilucicola]|uniref:NAD(P)-dependent dehydrogenase (Short-subunit alcohol dehydrogenase family) n=1 Tax=Sulfitobacter noctilucicola TaxID=1342301 RepID=A0A7W6M8P9_9RHOB|nr:SDR family oxidoreductase [Sulfitobacter noctilucicola]KIN64312.1 3-ketoacyl-(Acyl-carrier-protein) reductase [Sulfitobacter noctilucicola]MBB4174521.1 NAD(P)-dependent dehydrogenase (short-subunit alcohol dehydrogenase family) [Sulfitobacter noctilucicola]
MELNGKTVLVTGGSDGIGRHICLKLAAAGCNIAVLGRSESRLRDVAGECRAAGAGRAVGYACDMRDSDAIVATVERIAKELPPLDIVINNAGIWHKTGPLDDIPAQMVEDTIATNMTGAIQLTRAVLPGLRTRPDAAVLNVISKSGILAQAGQSVYTATKYGMRGFTDVLKEDEAQSGVRVAGLYQSGTNTGMFAKAGEEVPNHIFTEPDDLADVVVFMLSRPPKLWMHDVRIEL